MTRSGPLADVRVLDLTRVLAGPFATMVLGDLGAEVIKIERPGRGDDTRDIPPYRDGISHYFLSANRNKRSVAVDLKCAEGCRIVRSLARTCDVVVENFRPGVAAQLHLDYERIRAARPDVIYCSVSGFGQDVPGSQRPVFDIALQALSGAMSVTGEPGASPIRLGVPIGDLSAGLYAAIGVLAALAERGRTGKGQRVDVSMLDSTISLLGYLASRYLMTGESPGPVGGGHHSIVPYGVFATRDGYLVLAGLTDAFWPKLCRALDLPDYARDARYAKNDQRVQQRRTVNTIIQNALLRRTVAEWCERLTDYDVPHAPILSVGEALRQEAARVRGTVREVEHPVLGNIELLAPVLRFPDGAQLPASAPPALGADTKAVLEDLLGLAPAELERLEAAGVVAT